MKHIFVVNPVSGKGKNAKNYIPTIEKYIREKNLDADIYVTSASRDGMKYVEDVAKKVGYPYASYFSRVFKNSTGFSPEEFYLQKAVKELSL
jgi:AraC-like DNA-binding protein